MSRLGVNLDGFVLDKSTPSPLVESDQDSQEKEEEEMDNKQVTVTMSIEEMKKYFKSAQDAQQTNKKLEISHLSKFVELFNGKDAKWLPWKNSFLGYAKYEHISQHFDENYVNQLTVKQ